MARLVKKKIYLDTSVINHLYAEDTPEKMKDTILFWKNIMDVNEFEIYISDLVISELAECSEPKRQNMFNSLEQLKYIKIEQTDQVLDLAEEYLKNKVLSEKSMDDLIHIAFAVTNNINYIVSWNFKHFVNIKTIDMVNAINILLGYRTIQIFPPSMIMGGVN
ncbi:MAG: hypothetical protein A2Y24_02180 [Clostridiales bacterium GWE2_32_10]|nr:MAG: hypothetical protein A2Y24_02180 [Clostridiales bacterium GWE2_32_10]